MSTIHGTTELGPATAKRQVYSPLETYGMHFRSGANARGYEPPCATLVTRELMDIGRLLLRVNRVGLTLRR